MKASIGAAFDSCAGVERPQVGDLRDDLDARVAWPSRWSEQTSTSDSTGWSRSPSSLAGTWWRAAATRQPGTAACTLAATEPRGRHERLELVADPGQGVGHAR